jgi:hypothetical protein
VLGSLQANPPEEIERKRRRGRVGGIYLLNPTTNVSDLIASGGTRGDYTQVDTNNGSLLLDYSDIVARLTCPSCSFVPPSTPEPATWAMMLMGFAGLAFLGYRRTLKARLAA